MGYRGLRLLAVGAALWGTSPAWALFGSDEAIKALQARVGEVEERVNRLALEVANGDTLRQQELSRLQGAVEELRFKIDQLEKRQRDLYLDLDRQLRELSAMQPPAAAAMAPAAPGSPAAAATPPGGGQAPAAVANPASTPAQGQAASTSTPTHNALFAQALKALQGQQPAAALRDFEAFLAQYANDSRSIEARFWAGTAALQLKEFEKARQHFARIVFDQPRHELAPDAMLGLANALQGLGDRQGAHDMLSRLVERHPNTPAGKIARERLGR